MVTIPMPAASMVIAVDKGVDHLVGMHEASWIAIRDGIMGEMFPAAAKIAHGIATQDFAPNVESIVALNPDVVVQWGDEGTGIVGPLEDAGLDVVGLSYGTQRDLTEWITLFGTLLGQERRAKRLNARLDERMTEIKNAAPGTSGTKPSIVYFNRFEGGLKVAARESYNDFYIDLVGGTNPAT
ncbi:MAG: ABC transporter substrate-binding protein, partial [Actinophytocola sp.]|nr:ABC transporter substrate-binding protein [Actinophytocola sp.]